MTGTPGTLADEARDLEAWFDGHGLRTQATMMNRIADALDDRTANRVDKARAWDAATAIPRKTADEIASLRARVEVMRDALEKLIVVVEFEVPPIRDGVDVDHRLDVLAMSARDARQALNDTPDAE